MEVEHEEPTIQQILLKVFHEIKRLNENLIIQTQKTEALGKSCHKAFLQIKEAMHTLREELSEASGTLIDATWDYS